MKSSEEKVRSKNSKWAARTIKSKFPHWISTKTHIFHLIIPIFIDITCIIVL